ncbi:cytochrome P450 2U1 [Lepeophtheirus salmonis]|uniref:Cytochrome P450 2J2like [Sarcophilus harrisii] n=1 Tax=Lepeophtheirus salmonis TaxID=72036 RepID=A0A0K2SXB5_LEPSM|nr:cytochrome P450 2U1-like [Lepeophtheirus salmonis]QGA72955.1 cytochrome P450 3041E2 [Lepeophtheirus salmonis salmonis]
MFLITFGVLFIIITCYIVQYYWNKRHLPPGLPSLPLLGSIPFLQCQGLMGILDPSLMLKYGKLYTIDVIWNRIIVINDFSLAKNLFNRDDMSGRIQMYYETYVKGYNGIAYGIASSEGILWQNQRRFSLMKLKNLGFGKKSIEIIIYEQIINLFEMIETQKDSFNDLFIKDIFTIPVVNVLWKIVASKSYDWRNSGERKVLAAVNEVFGAAYETNFFLEKFRHFLPYDIADKSTLKLRQIMEELIDEHTQNLDENSPNDFMDVYLIEMKKNVDSTFSKKQLASLCIDLFLAGAETTNTTLVWALLYMSLYEGVQEKCAEEINSVLGSRMPQEEDMKNLPYTIATLNEIQRLCNTAPASLPHKNLKDIKIGDYVVPKGTLFLANLIGFHHDPNIFENPQQFNPDRWLHYKSCPQQFVPFGFGKRICMGVSLAKKELYYFFVMLIKMFIIRVPLYHKRPDPNETNVSLTKSPSPFYVNITKRDV